MTMGSLTTTLISTPQRQAMMKILNYMILTAAMLTIIVNSSMIFMVNLGTQLTTKA
jgi:hypothetical protein